MKIDTSDYYPVTPGSSCDDDASMPAAVQSVADPAAETVSDTGEGSDIPFPDRSERSARRSKDSGEPAWETAVDRVANFLSWVLVPLLMPLYATILVFNLSILQFNSTSTKWGFCLVVFGITALVPMLLVFLLKLLGIVHDLGLNGRRERLFPYIITILSLGAAGWFMLWKGAPLWCGMFYFGGALAGLVNLLINFRWKISAHAAAIAGVVALLVCLSREGIPHPHIDVWISCAIALAGLLGSARVWLGRHTVMQVLAGSAVGFLSVFFLTLI